MPEKLKATLMDGTNLDTIWYEDGGVEYRYQGKKIRIVPGQSNALWCANGTLHDVGCDVEEGGVKEEQKSVRLEVVPTHIALDIQGNFHRGLMWGAAGGFVLALVVVAVAVKVLEYLRH